VSVQNLGNECWSCSKLVYMSCMHAAAFASMHDYVYCCMMKLLITCSPFAMNMQEKATDAM